MNISLKNEKNRQTYYGALDLLNPDLIVRPYPRGNGDFTVEFVKELMEINKDKQVLIFWDGASYHRGQIMRDFWQEVNENLSKEDGQVTCHLFAPYAPEENPIEAVGLSLKNLLRRCYRFCKNFNIMKRLFQLLVDCKLFTFPNLQKYDAFSCLI